MRIRHACASLVLSLASLTPWSMNAGLLQGADDPAPVIKPGKKADKADAKPASGDLLTQWSDLQARYKKIVNGVAKLQEEHSKAKDDETRKAILERFQKMAPAMETEMREIQPKLIALAPQVFAKDPTNVDAAEVVLSKYFHENRYADVISLADKFIASGKATVMVTALDGVSHFAMHDFKKAEELLKQAQKLDPILLDRLGGPYLAAASEYIGFWKTEQEIRAAEAKADDLPRVSFKTNKGEIILELFENEARNTVANFISLVEAKKYDGTLFHRVIPNFMAQGGDPSTLDGNPDSGGPGGPGYTIACECYAGNARKHFQGSISMAHAGKDTGGSQFFLTHLPTPHLNASAEEQRGHTVFGRIVKGMDVAAGLQIGDKIETATVIRKRSHAYEPKKTLETAPAVPNSNRIKLKTKGSTSKPPAEEKAADEKPEEE